MSISLSTQRPHLRRWRTPCWRWAVPAVALLASLPARAQSGSDPWENAVNVLKTAFTGTIATGLSLVAIVVGGLMFAYEAEVGEGKKSTVKRRGWEVRASIVRKLAPPASDQNSDAEPITEDDAA